MSSGSVFKLLQLKAGMNLMNQPQHVLVRKKISALTITQQKTFIFKNKFHIPTPQRPMNTSTECRAAVLQAMVQALSVKYGCDCLGTEDERRLLANMGPEERFRALQIEFIALAYRLETREMELRESMVQLSDAKKESKRVQPEEEEAIAKNKRTSTSEALHSALEQDRTKLKTAIDADLMQHIPKQRTVTLENLLHAAGAKPKNTSTRSKLHALLSEYRETQPLYPVEKTDEIVQKLGEFVKGNAAEFDAIKVTPIATTTTLPWNSTVGGGKRKHPVDKVWDCALDHSHPKR